MYYGREPLYSKRKAARGNFNLICICLKKLKHTLVDNFLDLKELSQGYLLALKNGLLQNV